MINFGQMGDTTINDAVGLRDWYVEYARVAQLDSLLATGGLPFLINRLPTVQCVALYDLFLSESLEGGFHARVLLHNFEHVYEGSNKLAMETHGEASLPVVLDQWASWQTRQRRPVDANWGLPPRA